MTTYQMFFSESYGYCGGTVVIGQFITLIHFQDSLYSKKTEEISLSLVCKCECMFSRTGAQWAAGLIAQCSRKDKNNLVCWTVPL